MKVSLASVGQINAVNAINHADMAIYMKAVAGKKTEIDVDGAMTISDFVAESRIKLGIPESCPISKTEVLLGTTVLSGATLSTSGVVEGSSLTIKFIYNH